MPPSVNRIIILLSLHNSRISFATCQHSSRRARTPLASDAQRLFSLSNQSALINIIHRVVRRRTSRTEAIAIASRKIFLDISVAFFRRRERATDGRPRPDMHEETSHGTAIVKRPKVGHFLPPEVKSELNECRRRRARTYSPAGGGVRLEERSARFGESAQGNSFCRGRRRPASRRPLQACLAGWLAGWLAMRRRNEKGN